MATIKMVIRKKKLSNGRYPICLRITENRKTKYFKTLFDARPGEWDYKAGVFKDAYENSIQYNRLLLKIKDHAYSTFSELRLKHTTVSLKEFETAFREQNNSDNSNMFKFWHELISDLNKAGRTGNAQMYQDSLSSFKSFLGNENLSFNELNVRLLTKYEVYLRSRGGSDGGISVRMRALRAVYNRAISMEIAKKENYPFDKYKIGKLKGKSTKRALDLKEITAILAMDISEHPHLTHSLNYFKFSFYNRGMNFADMMKLKWTDVGRKTINYKRSKTKGNFSIQILPPVQEILDFYSRNSIGTKYVFPILLQDNLSPIQIENRKKKTLKYYNQDLKEIGELCEIKKTITSYVARHSFANFLKQKGVATDIISESLGHKNLSITQVYLKELDNSVIDNAMTVLLN